MVPVPGGTEEAGQRMELQPARRCESSHHSTQNDKNQCEVVSVKGRRRQGPKRTEPEDQHQVRKVFGAYFKVGESRYKRAPPPLRTRSHLHTKLYLADNLSSLHTLMHSRTDTHDEFTCGTTTMGSSIIYVLGVSQRSCTTNSRPHTKSTTTAHLLHINLARSRQVVSSRFLDRYPVQALQMRSAEGRQET